MKAKYTITLTDARLVQLFLLTAALSMLAVVLHHIGQKTDFSGACDPVRMQRWSEQAKANGWQACTDEQYLEIIHARQKR